MQCEKVWDLLSVYADGEATPQEAAIVETHIATCQDCARDLAFMRGTHDVLQDVPEVEPPATLRSAILAATVNRPSLPQRLALGVRKTLAPAPVRYGALAAAGAAAALTAVILTESSGPVLQTPSNPPIVAASPVQPHTQPSVTPERPEVDLLDVYEPPAATTRVAANVERRTSRRTLRMAQQPVRTALRSTSKPSFVRAASKGNPTAATAPEITASDDLHQPAGGAALTNETIASDPEPTTRIIASSSENPSTPASSASGGADMNRSARIVLTASAVALDPQQVATLADLRRSLAHGSSEDRVHSGLPTRPRDKQIRVDVLRSSF